MRGAVEGWGTAALGGAEIPDVESIVVVRGTKGRREDGKRWIDVGDEALGQDDEPVARAAKDRADLLRSALPKGVADDEMNRMATILDRPR